MIDSSIGSLRINIYMANLVIQIHTTGSQESKASRERYQPWCYIQDLADSVPSKKGGMGREDAGKFDIPLACNDKAYSSLPLMEVGNQSNIAVEASKLTNQQRGL